MNLDIRKRDIVILSGVRTAFAWPVRICSAADTIAWKPEPHRRFSVIAGTCCGVPAFRPT